MTGPQNPYQPQYHPPQPLSPDDERTWSLLSHVGTLLLGFIAPLIVLLVFGSRSPMVRAHSVESLNFQITLMIGGAISAVLAFVLIGFFTFFAIAVCAVVFAILATIAASKGLPYRYPLTLRLVR